MSRSERNEMNVFSRVAGFDGTLEANIRKGLLDLQLSRLSGKSHIHMDGDGTIILRLAEVCQKSTAVNVTAGSFISDKTLKFAVTKSGPSAELLPVNVADVSSLLVVDCKRAHVLVSNYEWSQAFKNRQ